MGFDRRSPKRPNGDKETLSSRSPRHTNTWWDDRDVKHEETCYCDTGVDHKTPRADPPPTVD